jgi:hypothetical protein
VSNPKLQQAIDVMKERAAALELATLKLKAANDARELELRKREREERLEPLPLRRVGR